MKIKELTLIFENCEYVTIDGKYIGHFLVSDIKKSIERIAINSISEMTVAERIAMEIHKDADIPYNSFGMVEPSTFDRITSFNDITSIEFILVDSDNNETKHQYYVMWDGDTEYNNKAQKTLISTNEHLYVVIDAARSVEEFFDTEFINCEAYNNLAFWELEDHGKF